MAAASCGEASFALAQTRPPRHLAGRLDEHGIGESLQLCREAHGAHHRIVGRRDDPARRERPEDHRARSRGDLLEVLDQCVHTLILPRASDIASEEKVLTRMDFETRQTGDQLPARAANSWSYRSDGRSVSPDFTNLAKSSVSTSSRPDSMASNLKDADLSHSVVTTTI